MYVVCVCVFVFCLFFSHSRNFVLANVGDLFGLYMLKYISHLDIDVNMWRLVKIIEACKSL